MILSPIAAVLVSIMLIVPAVRSDLTGLLFLLTIGPLLLLVAGGAWLHLAVMSSGIRRFFHATAFLLLFPLPIATMVAPSTVFILTQDAADLLRWHFGGETFAVTGMTTVGGGLPHVAWREWGLLSVWTEAYLVFDEADALAGSAFRGGKVPGVPCGAWHVLPLWKHWYVVTLYSGQTWDGCG